ARYIRDHGVIQRGQFVDCVLVRLSRGGTARGNFGEAANVEMREGDIYVSDLSQPIDISVGHSEHINLFVPKGALDRPGRALHGTLFHRDRLPCRMLTQHLLYLLESVSASRKAPVAVLVR